ncbi:MAG: PepSY-associated TM helix domain-containing protein [Bacteroidota bacterium]
METVRRPPSPPARPPTPAKGKAAPAKQQKLVGPRAFKLLWDTHSVTGIVIGLGLFVIFYAGAYALYRGELHAWADPAMRVAEAGVTVDEAVAPLFAERPPAQGTDVQVNLPFRERAYYSVRYRTPVGDTTEAVTATLSLETGEVIAEDGRGFRSDLSEILYKLHFFGQAGFWGELVAGFIAVFFLLAVASGILIHLRKLPKDWHTFRPRGKLRDALADAHTVLGLIGLPFAAMYAISGAFLALLIILLAPTVLVVFGGDLEAIDPIVNGYEMPPHEPTGEAAEMLSFAEYVEALPASWEGTVAPTFMSVHGWGDQAGIVQVFGEAASSLTAGPQAILQATTGEVLAANNPTRGTALGGTTAALVNLHYGRMGPGTPVAKVLYFFLALATAAVILTGNILWVLVRRPKDPRATPKLHRFLARLTVGVGCGLAVAVPVLFLTTAALPIELPSLKTWENVALFGAWGALTVAAFAGPSAVWAARWQLGLAGALSLLVPPAGGALGGMWIWTAAASGLWGLVTVDVGFLLMGPALLWTARRLRPDALAPALAGDGATAEAAPAGPIPAPS